jgi:hypothetical protein
MHIIINVVFGVRFCMRAAIGLIKNRNKSLNLCTFQAAVRRVKRTAMNRRTGTDSPPSSCATAEPAAVAAAVTSQMMK